MLRFSSNKNNSFENIGYIYRSDIYHLQKSTIYITFAKIYDKNNNCDYDTGLSGWPCYSLNLKHFVRVEGRE